ncbi:MAG: hypothetical protein ACKVHE_02960 [Planctomycetales bacterium]|jgi:hypothetical protein
MSDDSGSTQLDDKTTGVPPLFLLGGFILVATAGSAYFVMPGAPQPTIISSTLVIPIGPDRGGATKGTIGTTTQESVEPVVGPANTDPPAEPTDPETARLSKLIVGSWKQDFYGERTLTVKADGKATMTILPSGVFALGFGAKIDLTMFWSVKDGHLDYGVNGGTPADKVKLAASTWGDHWVEKIIELTETKLDLLSVDGSSHSIWERVPSEVASQAE